MCVACDFYAAIKNLWSITYTLPLKWSMWAGHQWMGLKTNVVRARFGGKVSRGSKGWRLWHFKGRPRYFALVNHRQKLKSSPKSSLAKAARSPVPKASVPANGSVLAQDTPARVPTTKAAASSRARATRENPGKPTFGHSHVHAGTKCLCRYQDFVEQHADPNPQV